jgi:hypothetical protein
MSGELSTRQLYELRLVLVTALDLLQSDDLLDCEALLEGVIAKLPSSPKEAV